MGNFVFPLRSKDPLTERNNRAQVTWLRDLVISDGSGDGTSGADGTDGLDGADGADGVDGATGPTGATGSTGAAGADGTDGADGVGSRAAVLMLGGM